MACYVKDNPSVLKLHKVEKKRRCTEINGPENRLLKRQVAMPWPGQFISVDLRFFSSLCNFGTEGSSFT